MQKTFQKLLQGYHTFRDKYAVGDDALMKRLSHHGQKPKVMMVSCCDSRVDPALLLQCEPGDLFIARNVANIVPPFESDENHHGTSAALEFGVCYLNVKHLIIMGHSQCGGINAVLNGESLQQNDFISNWVSLIRAEPNEKLSVDEFAQQALLYSYQNCLTFPWIQSKVQQNELTIHLWFFDIHTGQIFAYQFDTERFEKL